MRTSPLLSFPLALFAVAVLAAPGCYDDTKEATPYVADAGQDGGSPLKFACGRAGAACAGGEYCAFSTTGSCGKNGEDGACKARPTSCGPECPLACGCDGKPYCNPCEAWAAGSDTGPRTCIPSGGEILSFSLPTDPPKLVVFKKDTARGEHGICVRLTLIHRLGSKFGLNVPAEWGVDDAIFTDDASDCTITGVGLPPTPKGTAPQAVGGGGEVKFSSDTGQAGKYPCTLTDVNVRLKFDPQPEYNWLPAVEEVAAKDVTVAGACP